MSRWESRTKSSADAELEHGRFGGERRRDGTSLLDLLRIATVFITGRAVQTAMGRIIYTISVPENSVADAKLKEWKAAGENVSQLLCLMIEDHHMDMDHLQNLKRKLRRLAKMTDGGKAMNKDDWDFELGSWLE